jgi:bifunctional non-homologous end joining protein LigD
MLASTAARLPEGGGWLYELKLDGYRIVAETGDDEPRLWSRGGHDYASRFPEVAIALAGAVPGRTVLDGEVCALDERGRPRFQLLQSGAGACVYYAFDLLELDGASTRELPLAERRLLLDEQVAETPVIRISHTYDDGSWLLDQARRLELEGVMAKRAGSRYRPGARSPDWVKLKLRDRGTFVICGYTAGTGSRTELGALVLGEDSGDGLHWIGETGTGFSAAEIDRLLAALRPLARRRATVERPAKGVVTWVEPVLFCEVEFTERTREGRLRAPTYLGLTPDSL